MSRRVLVTGGAGFIGSHVADEMLRRGYEVVVLDDLSGGFRDNVSSQAHFFQGSVVDDAMVQRLFAEWRFEYVFHLAAYAAEGLSHFIRKFNYENNLIGSTNLINASVNYDVKCFVFASSIAVYGANQLPMTEAMVPEPEDPYGIAKYAVELDLKAARKLFGLNSIVFRPHNVYGERQNIGDKYRNVVGIFMNKVLLGEELPIFGDGEQTRAFSYVGDVAPIIAGSVGNPKAYNETFNIGADQPFTVNQLANAVSTAMGVQQRVQYLPARLEVKHAYSSHKKIAEILGYEAKVPLETGVARMAEWAKAQGARQSQSFGTLDIERQLPPAWAPKAKASAA